MFAKSSDEGIFSSNMHKRIIIVQYAESQRKIGTWEIGFIIFLSVSQRLIIFLSVSQRAIQFFFQKRRSAIASIS